MPIVKTNKHKYVLKTVSNIFTPAPIFILLR